MKISEMVFNNMGRNLNRKMNKLIGKVSLVKPIIDKLGINEIFEEVLKDCPNHIKVSNGLLAEVMVLNRLVAPMPMYDIEEWVDKETCVGEVYKVETGSTNDDRIADILDDTNPKIQHLWNIIVPKAISEYNIPTDIVYNDITSVYFEGAYAESEVVKHGYSRDQKPDKKQINLGINSNYSGIPLVYSVFGGNKSDKTTVIDNMEKVIGTINEIPKSTSRPMIVGDRAMLDSKIIVAYHKRDDLDYLGTLKLTNAMKDIISKLSDEEYKLIDTKTFHGLYQGYETDFEFENKGEKATSKVLIVRSEQKFLTDQKQRKKNIQKFTNELDDLNGKLNKKYYKKLETVEDRISILKNKFKGSKYVNVKVCLNSYNNIELTYNLNEEKISMDSKLDGKYMIATNRENMTPEEMVEGYKVRDISEKNFSVLKGPLYLRPIFLHKDKRIESLVFFSMVALLIYSILKLLLVEAEVKTSINNVLHEFKTLGVTCIEFTDNSKLRFASDLNSFQNDILERLKFPYPEEYINLIA